MEDFVKNDLSKINENIEIDLEINSNNDDSLTKTKKITMIHSTKSNELKRGYDFNYNK